MEHPNEDGMALYKAIESVKDSDALSNRHFGTRLSIGLPEVLLPLPCSAFYRSDTPSYPIGWHVPGGGPFQLLPPQL